MSGLRPERPARAVLAVVVAVALPDSGLGAVGYRLEGVGLGGIRVGQGIRRDAAADPTDRVIVSDGTAEQARPLPAMGDADMAVVAAEVVVTAGAVVTVVRGGSPVTPSADEVAAAPAADGCVVPVCALVRRVRLRDAQAARSVRPAGAAEVVVRVAVRTVDINMSCNLMRISRIGHT